MLRRTMAASRHLILYEVRLWQRSRLVLGIGAVAFLAMSAVLPGLLPHDRNTPNAVGLVGMILLLSLIAIWVRMRFSYVVGKADRVVIRRGRRRVVLPAASVTTVRTASLKQMYSGQPKSSIPLPVAFWNPVPALVLSVDKTVVGGKRFTRAVGKHAVLGNDVVLPVANAEKLAAALQDWFGERVKAPGAAAAKRPSKRRHPRRR